METAPARPAAWADDRNHRGCGHPAGAGNAVEFRRIDASFAATLVAWAFVASWAALFYSLSITGLGWQTGWTPWWRWVRGQRPPPRPFVVRGAYRFLRHPVSLSFLGLVWFVPVVTLDRAVLIAVWTGYIFAGSVLKDRRLLFFIGEEYRSYQSEVPGYPGVPMGPLARILLSPVSPSSVSLPAMIPTIS